MKIIIVCVCMSAYSMHVFYKYVRNSYLAYVVCFTKNCVSVGHLSGV